VGLRKRSFSHYTSLVRRRRRINFNVVASQIQNLINTLGQNAI
jgi:hypothetical protein